MNNFENFLLTLSKIDIDLVQNFLNKDPSLLYRQTLTGMTALEIVNNLPQSLHNKLYNIFFDTKYNKLKSLIAKYQLQNAEWFEAIERSNVQAIENILKNNPNAILFEDKEGNTGLHYAIKNSSVNNEIIQLLINNGAVIDKPNDVGTQPIHYAVQRQDPEITRLLLQKNPTLISVRDEYGKMSIHYAAGSYNGISGLI